MERKLPPKSSPQREAPTQPAKPKPCQPITCSRMWPLPTTNGRILLMTQAKHKRTVLLFSSGILPVRTVLGDRDTKKWSRTKTIATLASGVQPQEFSDFRSRCSRWRSSQCSISATRDTEGSAGFWYLSAPSGCSCGRCSEPSQRLGQLASGTFAFSR